MIDLSVGFLLSSIQKNWGDPSIVDRAIQDPRRLFLEEIEQIRKDLINGMRTPEMKIAVTQFLNGITILLEDRLNPDGINDVQMALDRTDRAYPGIRSTTEKILCYQLMTACFFVVREEQAAITSIYAQMEILFRQWDIASSIRSLCDCLRNENKRILYREEKAILDLFFSRICATMFVCGKIDNFQQDHKGYFQKLFIRYMSDGGGSDDGSSDGNNIGSSSSNKSSSSINNQFDVYPLMVHNKWKTLRVYKMATPGTVAVAATPAAIVAIADPLTAALALGTIPLVMRLKILSKPLSEFDKEPNLYNMRIQIMLMCAATTN